MTAGYGDLSSRYVLLEGNPNYDIVNTGATEIEHNLDVFIPRCPNDRLKGEHKIVSVAIDNLALSAAEIEQADSRLPDTEGEIRYRWPRRMEPKGRLRFSSRWIVVKEISDTEIWTSLIPTSRLEFSVEMQVRDLDWGVDPLHHGTLAPIGGRVQLGVNDFDVRQPLLPYQGVLFWWRPKQSLVEAQSAAPVEAQSPEKD